MQVADTSFIIDLSNSDPGAVKIAENIDQEGSVVALSAVSVHEYLLGIHVRYFGDKETLKAKIEAAERDLLPFMILPLTHEIAMESARIQALLARQGKTIGINDIYIAATAMVNKATVVTRNVAHFEYVQGLSVERY